MKRLFLSLALFLLLVLGASAQKTYAVLAAVSSYANSEMNLSYTTKDAKDLAKVFRKQGYEVTLLTSRYANAQNIANKLKAVAQKAGSRDRILFFFSGHGGTGLFCTYDANFPYSDLVKILTSSSAREIICFMDACHSGSVQDAASDRYGWSEGTRLCFIMSSRASEYSMEHSWVGHGFLAKALIKALRGKADSNGDRIITLGEAYKYIYKDVTRRAPGADGQHPTLVGSQSMSNCVLAKWK